MLLPCVECLVAVNQAHTSSKQALTGSLGHMLLPYVACLVAINQAHTMGKASVLDMLTLPERN